MITYSAAIAAAPPDTALPAPASLTEVVGAGPLLGAHPLQTEGLDQYLARGGHGTGPDPLALLDLVTASDLRGRGGAGFPFATKLRTVRDRPGAKVVVANGEEGEPGSVKDRHLMRSRPHLVLDGLRRAAAITGAASGYVYVSDPLAAQALRDALRDWWHPLPIGVVEVEHTYVAGEESAVVRRLSGGPALPTAKPPRPFEKGVLGAPTLVSNVETLAHLALLAMGGPATDRMLVTVSGAGLAPALCEVPLGSTLRALTRGRHVTGALVGGMFGGLLGPEVLDLPLTHEAFRTAGGALGCGAVHLLGPGDCPIAIAAEALSYLAAESSRQCGVCVSGTRSLASTVASLSLGTAAPEAPDQLRRWTAGLAGRGACGLLDAAVNVTASLLRRPLEPLPGNTAPAGGRRLRVEPPAVRLSEGAIA